MRTLTIDLDLHQAPTHDLPSSKSIPENLPPASASHGHPSEKGITANASLFFIGTATTILEWEGLRILTDPNFLHAGDHVHLGPGVTGTRKTNPAVDLHDLPNIDVVLLSHYHADHFDEEVERSLRRDLPIVTTVHAQKHLSSKGHGESFTSVHAVDFWEELLINFCKKAHGFGSDIPQIKITGMPGKHIPDGVVSTANDIVNAIPPTNGWMLELGYSINALPTSTKANDDDFVCGYRIYISGDTLLVSDLKQIPEHYTRAGKQVDLMLIHLGGTTIPGPSMPLLMVTMDAKQGIELVKLISPDLTIPIHYDDYDVFLSPLSDFKDEVEKAGLKKQIVYLERGEEYKFKVRDSRAERTC